MKNLTNNSHSRNTPDHYEIIERNRVYDGFYQLDNIKLRHELFNGGVSEEIHRELMVRHDAVCVLLFDPINDLYLFTEQFRVGALNEDSAWLFELVAGLIDKAGEDPADVARREAIEEAGVELGQIKFITEYLPSPGGTQEKVFLYVAQADLLDVDGSVHGLEEEGEDIRVHVFSSERAFQLMSEGKMNNPACIIALMWMKLNKEALIAEWSA